MKFIDTNVLVYYVDRRDPAKREKARSIVVEAVRNGGFAITYQSLNEFKDIRIDLAEEREVQQNARRCRADSQTSGTDTI